MATLEIDELVSPAQAARLLGLTPQMVRWLANHGRLGCVKTACGRLFDRSEVEKLAERRRQAE